MSETLFNKDCGLGMLLVPFVGDAKIMLITMFGVGIAWASILSMPYAMLSNAILGNKIGFYMGVFNFFIVLSQIAASLGLSYVMSLVLGGKTMNAVLLYPLNSYAFCASWIATIEKVTPVASTVL